MNMKSRRRRWWWVVGNCVKACSLVVVVSYYTIGKGSSRGILVDVERSWQPKPASNGSVQGS